MGARKLIAAAVLAACLNGCSGPRVTASDVRVAPSPQPGCYRVEARLANAGGRGQVEVVVRLRNQTTGRVVTQARPVDVDEDDQLDVVVDVRAPAAHYTPRIEIQYPPR